MALTSPSLGTGEPSIASGIGAKTPVLLLALALAGALWLLWRAFFDPALEFLPPGNSPWLVHPNLPIETVGSPPTPPVAFTSSLPSAVEGEAVRFQIRAFRQAEIRLSGSLEPIDVDAERSWKRASTLELPVGGTQGDELSIVVRNPTGPPALSVHFEDPILNQLEWTARIEGSGSPGVAAVRANLRYGKHRAWLGAITVVFGVWIAIFWHRGVTSTRDGRAPDPGRKLAAVLLLVVMTIAFLLADLSNARRYPISRGYDSWGHQEYIAHLAAGKPLPDARDGWQMYQPPLYYSVATLLGDRGTGKGNGSPTPGQFLNCLAHALLGPLAFGFCRLLFAHRSRLVGLLAALSALALPAGMQLAPMVGNEPFAGTLIAATLLAVAWTCRTPPRIWHGVFAGALISASMLAKFTGVLALAAGAAAWLLAGLSAAREQRTAHWKRMVALLLVVVAMTGWYYLRNQQRFGDPLVGNWDASSGFNVEQNPGYRDLAGIFRFGPALVMGGPATASSRSILEGFFASMWADPHDFFLAPGAFSRSQVVLLWLGLLPSALAAAGLAISWRRTRLKGGSVDAVVVAYSLLIGLALLLFNLEIPFFSTTKAFYAWSLFPLFAAWSTESLARLWQSYRWRSVPCALVTAGWIGLAIWIFLIAGPGAISSP